MEWVNITLGILAALFAGLNIFQVFTFRAYKKKYQALAEKDQAEAEEQKQSAIERRLDAMEKLYAEQGEEIDKLRKEVIILSKEKFENEKRIIQLEGENKNLKEKVDWLGKDLEAYKTLYERGPIVEHKY
jgi:septal ring factor EnvC (AmiA/AmiB activator)